MDFRVTKQTILTGIDPVCTQQIKNLTKLRTDVLGLGPDRIQFIRGYFRFTGLMTQVVDDIIAAYQVTQGRHTREFYHRLTSLQKDFANYVDKKIKHLQGLEAENDQPDPWWMLFQRTRHLELLNASNHVQDVLFSIGALSTHKFGASSTTIASDIDNLMKELEKYFVLLESNGQLGLDDDQFALFKGRILTDFQRIQTAYQEKTIDNDDFQNLLAQFKQDLNPPHV